ncbi:MAG TPA: LytR C-terminal domain-containing protein [Candidatus Angelobacter sp.]
MAAVASGDRSAPSTQTAQLTLEKAAKNEGLTAQVQTASMNVPTRVYIQIAAEDQRARAAKLQMALQNAGFIAPGIELRKDNSPNNTDIRYFSNDIKKQADQVKEEVLKQHFVVTKDPSNRDNGKVHLNQIEVWIGKDENASSTLQ